MKAADPCPMDKSDVIPSDSRQLNQLQEDARARDLQQRAKNIKLEDVMLVRAKGSRMIKPDLIQFDD